MRGAMTDDVRNKINLGKQSLGSDLYAFMLSVHSEELESFQPNPMQLQTISILEGYVEKLKEHQGITRRSALEHVFCTYFDDVNTSRAIYFHFFSLGQPVPPIKQMRDKLLVDILTIARDSFPAVLIDRDEFGGSGFFLPTYSHPLREKTALAMLKNSCPIRKLFPNAKTDRHYMSNLKDLWSVQSNVILSNGSFSQVSLASLVSAILSSAVYAPHSNLDPLALYIESVKNSYQRVSRLALGEEVNYAVLLGLGNINLDDSIHTISLPDATMRRISHIEKSAMFAGDPVNASIVVELQEKVKILEAYTPTVEDDKNSFRRLDKHTKNFAVRFEDIQKRIDGIRLAMILASEGDRVIAPSHSFTTSFSPLDMNRSWSTNPYRWPTVRYEQAIINTDDAKRINYWIKKASRAPKSLHVSVKRLISAATERIDDADAFIDAVMVWENMFGAKEETGLRIRSSIGLLLEPKDKDMRTKTIKTIKELYNKRSRLVHGSPDVELSKIYEDRQAAIDYAIRAFKKVLSSKKLLSAKDSAERGHMIIYRN